MSRIDNLKSKYKEFVPTPLTVERRPYYNKLLKKIFDGDIKIEKVTICECGTSKFEKLNEMDRFGLPFGTQICQSCGLVSLQRRISSESLDMYYDEIYWGLIFGDSRAEGELSTHGEEYGNQLFNYIKNQLPTHMSKFNILEIGSGTGEKLISIKNGLSTKGIEANLYALDFSSRAVDICKQKGINALMGGFDNISLFGEEKQFDIIILSHVVEHLVSPQNEIKKIIPYINKNTIIYIEVPGISSIKDNTDYAYDYNLYCVHAHMYNFTLGSLVGCMKRAGLELLIGDEFVRSIFKLNSSVSSSQTCNQKEVVDYTITNLQIAEEKKGIFLGKFKRVLKRKVKEVVSPGVYR